MDGATSLVLSAAKAVEEGSICYCLAWLGPEAGDALTYVIAQVAANRDGTREIFRGDSSAEPIRAEPDLEDRQGKHGGAHQGRVGRL